MIISFADAATEDLYHGIKSARVRRIPTDVQKATRRKLDVLNAVERLEQLRYPPGNHLEGLKGDWAGYHSIRVNQQWRIVFKWDAGAYEVQLVDYH